MASSATSSAGRVCWPRLLNTPTAFRPPAQGCAPRATLGTYPPRGHQPHRGCAFSIQLHSITNLRKPRALPWAGMGCPAGALMESANGAAYASPGIQPKSEPLPEGAAPSAGPIALLNNLVLR